MNENFEYNDIEFKVGKGYIYSDDMPDSSKPQGIVFYPDITTIDVSKHPFMRLALVEVDPESAEFYEDDMWITRWIKVIKEVKVAQVTPLLNDIKQRKRHLEEYINEAREVIMTGLLEEGASPQ